MKSEFELEFTSDVDKKAFFVQGSVSKHYGLQFYDCLLSAALQIVTCKPVKPITTIKLQSNYRPPSQNTNLNLLPVITATTLPPHPQLGYTISSVLLVSNLAECVSTQILLPSPLRKPTVKKLLFGLLPYFVGTVAVGKVLCLVSRSRVLLHVQEKPRKALLAVSVLTVRYLYM